MYADMGTADSPRREAWLDGLKGFAILLVILGHVLSGYLDAGTFPAAYRSLYGVRSWIYSFHMPLFFLISGFTFTLAYWRQGRLLRGRYAAQLFNLLWTYTLFALVQWCVKQAVPELVNESYDLEDLKGMFVTPLGNFWYLYVLFVFYLVAAALRLPRWRSMWVLLPFGVAVVVADAHLDWTALTCYRILYHFGFFALGSVLSRHRDDLTNRKLLGLSAMVLASAAYFYYAWHIRSWYGNWKVAIAVAICYGNLYLFRRYPRLAGCRLFQLCGKYCLELYLLHTFFTAGLRSLLPLLGITGPWLSVGVNFVISTVLSLLLAHGAGRHPWTDAVFHPSRFLRRREKTA